MQDQEKKQNAIERYRPDQESKYAWNFDVLTSAFIVEEGPEPVSLWIKTGAFQQFYSDPPKYGYSFQTLTCGTRTSSYLDALERNPLAQLIVVERCLATDRGVFWRALCEANLKNPLLAEDYKVYAKMYLEWYKPQLRFLNKEIDCDNIIHVFIDTPIDEMQKRVACRGRADEIKAADTADGKGKGGVDRAYQELLRRYQMAMFTGQPCEGVDPPHDENGNLMVQPSSVIMVGPELAGLDFKNPGPDQDRVVFYIVSRIRSMLHTKWQAGILNFYKTWMIAIQGGIGAGKSTILPNISKALRKQFDSFGIECNMTTPSSSSNFVVVSKKHKRKRKGQKQQQQQQQNIPGFH